MGFFASLLSQVAACQRQALSLLQSRGEMKDQKNSGEFVALRHDGLFASLTHSCKVQNLHRLQNYPRPYSPSQPNFFLWGLIS